MEEEASEERLKLLQDNRVYPVGRVLRETFDADNHDSLSSDVAGLMIDLSRVPFDPLAAGNSHTGSSLRPQPRAPRRAAPVEGRGILRRLAAFLRGR